MATSSIHKPGWRSRRRSRLSLVERAVPRLGRPPELDDITRTTRTERPSWKELAPSGNPPKGPPKTDLPKADVSSEPGKPGASGDSVLADKGETVGSSTDGTEMLASAVSTEAASPPVAPPNGSPIDMVPTAEESEARNGVATARTDIPSMARGGHPPLSPETPPVQDDAVVVPTSSSSSPEQASVTTRVDLEAGESETPPGTTVAGPPLELHWKQLVESGFVDPRDRARPLSKSMDEIIRALIRQALSDQSSWRDRVVLVTSPTERSSKTAASINFAFGLTTIASHHVVLVDVDTIGLGAVGRLGGGDHVGITAALADESITVDDLAIRTDLDRLTLVASGKPDEETLDHFASRRMLEILRYLTSNPDTILIIDAPPILLSQEAVVLSVVAGQVVMSVEAGKTTADQIEHALQRIGERHNVSLVLNESHGLAGDDAPAAADLSDQALADRPASGSRRRLPRTATAATVAALLGLLVAGSAGHAASVLGDLLLPADPAVSMPAAAPPERWSAEADQTETSCHRDCR